MYTVLQRLFVRRRSPLNVVNVIIEIEEVIVFVAFLFKAIGSIVDAEGFREFPVRLQRTRFVSQVLQDDIRLLVLEVTQTQQDDVTSVHPNLLTHLTTDVTQALYPIDALRFQTSVPKHAQHLRILLTVLLEDEFSLLIPAVALPTAAILTTFSLGIALRHVSLTSSSLVRPSRGAFRNLFKRFPFQKT